MRCILPCAMHADMLCKACMLRVPRRTTPCCAPPQETSEPHGEHKFKFVGLAVVEDQDPLVDHVGIYGHFLGAEVDDAKEEQHKTGSGLNTGPHG